MTLTLTTRDHVLLMRQSARVAPDATKSLWFLTRARRTEIQASLGFADLLMGIALNRSEEDQEKGEADGDAENPPGRGGDEKGQANSHSAAHPDAGSTACSCETDSLDVRMMVIDRILHFLFEESEPGSVGRSDIDLFVDMARRYQWSVADFEPCIPAIKSIVSARRWATTRSLAQAIDGVARPLTLMIASTLFEHRPDEKQWEAATSWMRCVLMIRLLLRSTIDAREEHDGGRILCFALDALWKAGLRDEDFLSGVRDRTGSSEPNSKRQQVVSLLAREAQQIAASLLEADSTFSAMVSDSAARRVVTMFTGLQMESLRQFIDSLESGVVFEYKDDAVMHQHSMGRTLRIWMNSLAGRVDDQQVAALVNDANKQVSSGTPSSS